MDVLELSQRFADANGIPQPSVLVASQGDDERQILELLNQEGRALSRRYDWQALIVEKSFTTVATESQGTLTAIIGADQTLRRIIDDTLWDRTTQLPGLGPVSKQSWQAYKASNAAGPYPSYRIRGNQLLMTPVPTAGHSVYFEYVTNCWLTDSTGATYRRNIVADTDVFLLDDELLLAGLEWRWLRKKGLSYAEEFASYENLVNDAIANDGMRPVLSLDSGSGRYRGGVLVPVGGWNVS